MQQIAINPTECPACKQEGTRATFIHGLVGMEPGVLAICALCGNINVVNDDRLLETAPGYYLKSIEIFRPETYEMLMGISQRVKARNIATMN